MLSDNTGLKDSTFSEQIDRDLIREMIKETGAPGTLFGRGFELDEKKEEQLTIIQEKMEEDLTMLKDSDKYKDRWKKYEEITKDGLQRGRLLSFVFPPIWLVDSNNNNTPVRKIMIQRGNGKETAGVEVPTDIYSLAYYSSVAEHLKEYTTTSSDQLYKRSTSFLHKNLSAAGKYLSERGFLEKNKK